MPTRFHSYVLYSQLPELKRMAKSVKKAQGISHYAALDQVAQLHGYKAWSHLSAETEKAFSAWADIPEEIFEASLDTPLIELIETNDQAADVVIDELAKKFYVDLKSAFKDDETYLKSIEDFGDQDFAIDGEKSINGWRLYVDESDSYIQRRSWCEQGVLLAYIDASVCTEWMTDICRSEFTLAEDDLDYSDEQLEQAIMIGRLETRNDQVIHFCGEGTTYSDSPIALMDSCRSAICHALNYFPDA